MRVCVCVCGRRRVCVCVCVCVCARARVSLLKYHGCTVSVLVCQHLYSRLFVPLTAGVFSVFIYSMPGYKCPIKERMLYSSCKAPVIDVIEQNLGMNVDKKVRNASRCLLQLFLRHRQNTPPDCLTQSSFEGTDTHRKLLCSVTAVKTHTETSNTSVCD